MAKSVSVKIRYYTSENSIGHCGLWTAATTKQQLKEILDRHRINVDKVFRFEVNKGDGYHEVDVNKLVKMVTQHE